MLKPPGRPAQLQRCNNFMVCDTIEQCRPSVLLWIHSARCARSVSFLLIDAQTHGYQCAELQQEPLQIMKMQHKTTPLVTVVLANHGKTSELKNFYVTDRIWKAPDCLIWKQMHRSVGQRERIDPATLDPGELQRAFRGELSTLLTKQHNSKTRKHILTSSYVPFRRAWAHPTWREWCGLSTYPYSCAGKTGWNTPSDLEMNSKQWATLQSSSPQGDWTPGLVSHDYTTTCLQGYDVRSKICTRNIARNVRPHVNEVGVVLEMLLPLENLQQ